MTETVLFVGGSADGKEGWPGKFYSGENVRGHLGDGIVATKAFCRGYDESQRGKEIRGAGIREGLVPVRYILNGIDVGVFWESPFRVTRIPRQSHPPLD